MEQSAKREHFALAGRRQAGGVGNRATDNQHTAIIVHMPDNSAIPNRSSMAGGGRGHRHHHSSNKASRCHRRAARAGDAVMPAQVPPQLKLEASVLLLLRRQLLQ